MPLRIQKSNSRFPFAGLPIERRCEPQAGIESGKSPLEYRSARSLQKSGSQRINGGPNYYSSPEAATHEFTDSHRHLTIFATRYTRGLTVCLSSGFHSIKINCPAMASTCYLRTVNMLTESAKSLPNRYAQRRRSARPRLTQHFVNESKDRSIFRKNIGRCLLNRDNDPFLASWELDLTSRKARDAHAGTIDFAKQKAIERRVSEYIQNHFTFVVFEIPGKDMRIELESKLISTISLCPKCGPSKNWLGNHSPKSKIQESGLWQVNELHKTPLSESDIAKFQTLVINS